MLAVAKIQLFSDTPPKRIKRMHIFRIVTKTKKSFLPAYITPNGLLDNMYARKISREVKADALFS